MSDDHSPAQVRSDSLRRRVLVIEDDARLARGIGRLLRRHDVLTVMSARHALEIIQGSEPFDAILCDLRMPEMDGMEFFEALRVALPGSENRIVFMTGGPTSPKLASFVARVPNPVLEKPFTWETLENALASRTEANS